MSSVSKVYLVTGGGRGIGLNLVERLASQENTIVFAGVRTLPSGSDNQLQELVDKHPEVVFPVQITSASEVDNAAAAETIKAKTGKIDVIIANAGGSSGATPIAGTTPAAMINDFEINTIGPLVLFNAFSSLLTASGPNSKFIVISSLMGQITEASPYPSTTYGTSKAAVNFVVKKIDLEYKDIIAFPIHPGIVATDMLASGAKALGISMEQMGAIQPSESAAGILSVIEKATKKSHGGRFFDNTGKELTY